MKGLVWVAGRLVVTGAGLGVLAGGGSRAAALRADAEEFERWAVEEAAEVEAVVERGVLRRLEIAERSARAAAAGGVKGAG